MVISRYSVVDFPLLRNRSPRVHSWLSSSFLSASSLKNFSWSIVIGTSMRHRCREGNIVASLAKRVSLEGPFEGTSIVFVSVLDVVEDCLPEFLGAPETGPLEPLS